MRVELINKDEIKDFFKKWGYVACKCYNTDLKHAENVGKHCLESGHFSGSRGIYFFFDISEFSRNTSMQLNRHESGAFKNQQSQRYVDLENFGYYIPPRIAKNDLARKIYCDYIESGRDVYKKLIELLNEDGYFGEEANEEGRFILSGATFTEGVWGFTIEALINLAHKRKCVRSQHEISQLTNLIIETVIEILPEFKNHLVAQCEYLTWCPEKKSCGRFPRKNK